MTDYYQYAYAYQHDKPSDTKISKKNGGCAPDSPPNCFATPIDAKGYSAGQVLRITNGLRVNRADQKNSCPPFYKIWSPRNKEDWISVYNALERDYYNYPRKPFLIVDVTRPWNGCGGCSSHAMKSTIEQQGSWRTTDGSPWWLRDSKFKDPNGDYVAHCFMHVQSAHPDNVQFSDAKCDYYSSDYLCQPVATKWTCGPGSPANCIATVTKVRTYSAGRLVRITNGLEVKKSDQQNSCPTGYKIWSPRSKHDWSAVYNALGQDIRNYPRQPHLIVDVTRASDKCDTCDTTAMKSSAAHTSWWRTSDGSPWWLRDSVFPQPSDQYRANCYLSVYDVYPDHVKFEYGNCSFSSTDYLCQPKCTPVQPGACYGPAEKLVFEVPQISARRTHRHEQETSTFIVTIIITTAVLVLLILVAALYAKFCRPQPHDTDTPHNTNTSTANTRVNTHTRVRAIMGVNSNSAEPAVAVAVILNSSSIRAGEVIPVAKAVT